MIFPMAKELHKPFTRTELKILVFNRMKRGYSYDQAVEYVKNTVDVCIANGKKSKEKENKKNCKDQTNKTFKEEFSKLTHGKKR